MRECVAGGIHQHVPSWLPRGYMRECVAGVAGGGKPLQTIFCKRTGAKDAMPSIITKATDIAKEKRIPDRALLKAIIIMRIMYMRITSSYYSYYF